MCRDALYCILFVSHALAYAHDIVVMPVCIEYDAMACICGGTQTCLCVSELDLCMCTTSEWSKLVEWGMAVHARMLSM